MKTIATAIILFLYATLTLFSRVQQVAYSENNRGFIYGGFAWSPDGSMIAIASQTGVWVYETEHFDVVEHIATENVVAAVDWHPTESVIAYDNGNGVKVWNIAKDKNEPSFADSFSEMAPDLIRWNPNGSLLAVISGQIQNIFIWDREENVSWILDTQAYIDEIDWSPDGNYIVAVNSLSLIQIWDVKNKTLVNEWETNHDHYAVAWHPTETKFAIGGGTVAIEIWQPFTGNLITHFSEDGRYIKALAWSPDGKYMASVPGFFSTVKPQTLYIRDMDANEVVYELDGALLTGDSNTTNAISWSPDGSKLGMVSDDGKFYLWDGNTFELIGSYQLHDSTLSD